MSLNDILDALGTSKIIKRVVFAKFDGVSDSYVLKVRAELTNGWFMDCWEHRNSKVRRYSFHVFHGKEMVVRWDNTPHYPELKGFPCHKHEGKQVVGSKSMTIAEVLEDLKKLMATK